MGAILSSIGAAIVTSITTFLSSKALKVTTAIGILIILFFLIPFELSLPEEVYNMFISGTINNFFKSVSYFLPINFMLKCFLIVFATKYVHIFWNLIKFLWDKFID